MALSVRERARDRVPHGRDVAAVSGRLSARRRAVRGPGKGRCVAAPPAVGQARPSGTAMHHRGGGVRDPGHDRGVRLEAISWERLTDWLTERVLELTPADGGGRLRVAFDGAPAAPTGDAAEALAEALRTRGCPALVVGAAGFLRPASLRFEYGRRDADAYDDRWTDVGALWREVFTPLEPGGTGRVLPDLWDPVTDRATRSPYVDLPPGGVLLLHGPLLLGHWFPFDLSVHLRLSPAALARRTDQSQHWTLAAFTRYDEEVRPEETADVVVRADDPRHPAWHRPTAT